jgi:hypothetical protein
MAKRTDLETFDNDLRILRAIDYPEVEEFMTVNQHRMFCVDPYVYFIQCDPKTKAALWAVLLSRRPQ